MKFVVAVPRLLLSEEIDAESAAEAARRLRDSGAFDKGMTELMAALPFEQIFLDDPPRAYVIDPDNRVTVWGMDIGWRERE